MTREDANKYTYSYKGAAMKGKLCRAFAFNQEDVDMDPMEMFRHWLEWEGRFASGSKVVQALRDCGFVVEEVE